jgi:predicted nucleic acid-binding protein
MTWAFDADALIYAATPGHELGEPVWRALQRHGEQCFGSVFLIPEMLIRPVGSAAGGEVDALNAVLARLHLVDLTASIAALAVELGAAYDLRAADAVHLATAVWVGARLFVTNNRRDFKSDRIAEIDVVLPQELSS